MAHDPFGWPTPMHAWRYWVDQAKGYERDVYEIRASYEEKHGRSRTTDVMISGDLEYQTTIANQQFAVRQASLYADAAQIRLLEAILTEVRNPR